MTTQLTLYNHALGFIGERSLATLSDNTESRRVLDQFWTEAREYCLEAGHWKFAKKRELLTPSLTELPTFGYRQAFAKPANMVRVSEICSDEYFNSPLSQFDDRGAFWYADVEQLYVGYVSRDTTLGYDLTKWPQSFVVFFELYLATRIAPRLTPNLEQKVIETRAGIGLETAKLTALSKDAVAGPTQFLPIGNWVNSRRNRTNARNSRASLYGS